MDFNIDFNLVRSQKLLLIPQLKQAIEILEMNSRELFCYIEGQMETNPSLEKAADDEALTEVLNERVISDTSEEDTEAQYTDIDGNIPTLKEHLLIQLNAVCQDRTGYRIGEYLVDNTDDNGYLKTDVREVAEYLDVSEKSVLKVLEKLQSLEPPGICARNLKECLLLQLRQLDESDEEAILVVDRYLDVLASDNAELVASATGIPVDRIRKIFGKVRSLEPKPGREFYSKETESPKLPDIFIQDTKDGLQILYNEEAFPDICISESFALKAAYNNHEEEKSFTDKLNNAVWLIKCLEQREDIIFSIAQKLCEFEKQFFKKGPKAIVPIDKSIFSTALSMHEFILEKAVNGKYLQCRWGLYEMGSFFKK